MVGVDTENESADSQNFMFPLFVEFPVFIPQGAITAGTNRIRLRLKVITQAVTGSITSILASATLPVSQNNGFFAVERM